MSVSTVLENIFQCIGEGPHWDSKKGLLYCVDIKGSQTDHSGAILRFNPETKEVDKKVVGQPTSVIPCLDDSILFTRCQSICKYADWSSTEFQDLHRVEEGELTRFNDAKCDPSGRLVAGTMGLQMEDGITMYVKQAGSLYGLDGKSNELKVLMPKMSLSNGLAWSKDGQKLFYIDSDYKKVYVANYNTEEFSLSDSQVLLDFTESEPAVPDGCTIDSRERLWIAMFNGNAVRCFDTNTCQMVQEIKFEAKRITSCCFGGPDLNELYVTSANIDHTNDPMGGSLFRVTGLDAKGFPMVAFEC